MCSAAARAVIASAGAIAAAGTIARAAAATIAAAAAAGCSDDNLGPDKAVWVGDFALVG